MAEKHSPEDVADVLEAQARVALALNDLTTFEALMLRAQRAELVVQHYKVGMGKEERKGVKDRMIRGLY